MKKTFKLLSFLMVACMLLSSCAQSIVEVPNVINDNIDENNVVNNVMKSVGTKHDAIPEQGTYNKGVALVKYDGEMNDNVLSQLDLVSATALYSGSSWYTVELKADADTVETVNYLRELGCFEKVDYDYIMKADGEVESVDIAGNPNYDKAQKDYYKTQGVTEAWKYLEKEGKNPGGSPDVIVAVIDTGVDYNHLDLRNNIWVNPAEIPDNGKDDDGNGYVDDIYGWNCVGDNNNPMDDNGHGTHVAGIIAAENNKEGGIGIAYNCKVMVLKAGNSSGYFNNSDIAEAVQYAYMNGASVINMSFGGSQISLAVEEALENAYNTSILVAAAGNDAYCNSSSCEWGDKCLPIYPAAFPYVIGVMSTSKDGKQASSFTNCDHSPYDSIEYEVYAVGEQVYSCWPNDRYATLNGTSMASPIVAGIAALLRSHYSDREVYATTFIQSQIVNTGTVNPYKIIYGEKVYDTAHTVADVFEALTKFPKPKVNLYDYSIDDSTSISTNNNGNGIIDAGETVRLYISLHNRGGVATNVDVSIDTIRNGDASLVDPYFTFNNSTIHLSDIGTYSVRKSDDKYFEIIVDADCPNDYLVDFNIHFTYENGLDDKDKTVYEDDDKQKAQFNVSHGFHLPIVITEDTLYTADKRYIVSDKVVIPEGVTVTFEEGCEIHFVHHEMRAGAITVHGTLIFAGSEEKLISMASSDHSYGGNFCYIYAEDTGVVSLEYVTAEGLVLQDEIDYNDPVRPTIIGVSVNNSILYESSIQAEWLLNTYLYDSTVDVMVLDNCFFKEGFITSYSDVLNNMFTYKTNLYLFGAGKLVNNYFYSSDFYDYHLFNYISFEDYELWTMYGNAFSAIQQKYAKETIQGYYDSNGKPIVDVYGSAIDSGIIWPHIVSVEMFDKDGNPITTVGREEIKVRVTFNRKMDKNAGTFLTFGTIEPYSDYRIDGEYISDTVWEGTYTLKAQIENGQNFLKVNNAWAAEDPTKTVFGECQLHEFTIDTTAALSASLVANPTSKGIELSWMQDDYDTLMGYNVYRSMTKDGNYVKINPAILLSSDDKFIDSSVEPGVTYWYTFTTVLSDFTESNPAGITSATAIDSIPPTITHTPVTQGYFNRNLSISCNVTDNIQVTDVTLYYRTYGETEWHKLSMTKANNKYGATVFGSSISFDGLEYYIIASDGVGEALYGSNLDPMRVVIKHAYADHVFEGEWLLNDNGHWRICSVCGESENIASHTPGAAATETTPQTCTVCGYVIKAALGHKTHSFGTNYVINEYQHWYECACGARDGIENHVYDNACDTDCNTCGATRETKHIYGGNYVINEYQHWYECACGVKKDVENHVFDNACDTDCNKCGITRSITHSYGSNYIGDEHQHWHECSCGAKEGIEDHVFDNVCDTNCNKCGATRTVEHSYESDYIINEYQHWNECSCGAKGSVENHTFDNAQDTDCNKCGFTRTVAPDDSGEKQSGCGSTISGAYVGVITLVSICGALVFKKKKED